MCTVVVVCECKVVTCVVLITVQTVNMRVHGANYSCEMVRKVTSFATHGNTAAEQCHLWAVPCNIALPLGTLAQLSKQLPPSTPNAATAPLLLLTS